MNWTVRSRFTARAAREGAIRIAVDNVIVEAEVLMRGEWGRELRMSFTVRGHKLRSGSGQSAS